MVSLYDRAEHLGVAHGDSKIRSAWPGSRRDKLLRRAGFCFSTATRRIWITGAR